MKQNRREKKKKNEITRCLREAVVKTNKSDGETKFSLKLKCFLSCYSGFICNLQYYVEIYFHFLFSLFLREKLVEIGFAVGRDEIIFFDIKTELSFREALVCRNDLNSREPSCQ